MNKLFSILLAILMITGLPALAGTAIGTITDAQAHPLPNTKVIVTSFSIPRSHSSGTAVQSKFSVFSDTNGVVTITNAVAGKYQLQPVGANLLQFSFYMPETNGTIYMEDHLVADAGNTLPPDTMSYGVTASDRRYAMLGSSVATNVIVYLFLETNLPVTSAWITNIVSPTLVKVYRGTNTLATWSGNAVTATSVTGSFSGDMTGTQGATVITGLGAERLAMIQTNLNTLITVTNLTQAERAALIATNTILVNAIAAERAALIATNNNLAGQIIAATNTPVITRFSTNVVTDVTISGGTINKSTNATGIAISAHCPRRRCGHQYHSLYISGHQPADHVSLITRCECGAGQCFQRHEHNGSMGRQCRNCYLSHHRDDGRNSHGGSHRCARHHCDHCRHRITDLRFGR